MIARVTAEQTTILNIGGPSARFYGSAAAGTDASIADGRRSDSIADSGTIGHFGGMDFGSHLFEP
jgi:hypothetical protein